MRKIKSDEISLMLDDIHEMEDSVLLEELSIISGIEFLLAATIMSCDKSEIFDLINFAKRIDSESDFVCALADGNSSDQKFLLPEVKDHLRAKYPSITSYLEDIYGCESESVSTKINSLFD